MVSLAENLTTKILIEKVVARARAAFLSLSLAFVSCLSAQGSTGGQISLSWNDNSHNEVGFEIERTHSGSEFQVLTSVGENIDSFSDTEVTPGMEYQYRVRAFNEFGYSGYTNVVTGSVENTAPLILDDAGQEVEGSVELDFQVGENLTPLVFSIQDLESSMDELEFEIIPTNPAIVPLNSISYSVKGNKLSIAFDTRLIQIGTTELSVIVSDGVHASELLVSLDIGANVAPRIASLGTHELFDGQTFGPYPISVIDDDTAPEDILITASSSDESMVASSNIWVSGSGSNRTITVKTTEGTEGTTTVLVHVDDGFSKKTAPLSLVINHNSAPEISLEGAHLTIPNGGRAEGISFTVADPDHGTSDLIFSVSTSNALLLPSSRSKVKGTGSSRTLDIVPDSHQHGTATLNVLVSDGIKTTVSETITVTVLPPPVSVMVKNFTVEDGFSIAEVESRVGATFTLQRTFSLASNIWEPVVDLEIIVDGTSTFLIDPLPVDQPVCYRVFASE